VTDAPASLLDRTLSDGSPAYFKSLAAYADARVNPGTGRTFTRAVASKCNKQGLIAWADAEPGAPAKPKGLVALCRKTCRRTDPLNREA
jgi:hypothetical protein